MEGKSKFAPPLKHQNKLDHLNSHSMVWLLYHSCITGRCNEGKLHSQTPHSSQYLALKDDIRGTVLNHTQLLHNDFTTYQKDLFSILWSMVSPHIPNICSFYVVAHHRKNCGG